MVAEPTRIEKLSTRRPKKLETHNEMNEIYGGNGMRGLREDLRNPTGLRTFNLGRVCGVWGQMQGSNDAKMSRKSMV